ncbi:MAG TPA: DUF4249 domain-containing protein [Bacteroidales bacterium]|nr:DUF4249 domain-containing protein [Bacteroidales bacterium]HPT02874.1 DUF4249 domain-containing protein [Bacteroidales bacterium]
MRLTYLLTAMMLLVAGCTEYESIEDFPIAEPALVANSLFQADSAITVYVSRSLSILDNAEIKPITDATVVIYKDGLAVDTIRESNESQAYVSAIFPESGHRYSVRVFRSGYDTVTSTSESLPAVLSVGKITAVPVDSTITELWYQDNVHDDSAFTYYSMDVALTINDPVNEHNIYSVMVLKEDSSIFSSDLRYQTSSVYFTSNDMSLLDNADLENSGSYRTVAYFDDRNFDGKQYQFKFRIEDNEWTTFAAKYRVLVRSLTETSYKYFRSLNSNYNETSPFDEPARVYTNIHNGFGIFAGYERKSYRIR